MSKPLFSVMCGAAMVAWWAPQAPAPLALDQIKLPPGFTLDLYATGVTNAREMVLGAKGTLFVGSRSAKTVYAIVDRDHIKATGSSRSRTGLTAPTASLS